MNINPNDAATAAAMALTNVVNTVRDARWTTESVAQNPWDVHRPSKNIQRGDRVYFLQMQIPSRHRPPFRPWAIHLAAHTVWFGVSHLDCQEKKSQVRRRCRTGARFDAASSYGGSSIIAETRYLEWTFPQRSRMKKSPFSSFSFSPPRREVFYRCSRAFIVDVRFTRLFMSQDGKEIF